jgi:hypothetical protein
MSSILVTDFVSFHLKWEALLSVLDTIEATAEEALELQVQYLVSMWNMDEHL